MTLRWLRPRPAGASEASLSALDHASGGPGLGARCVSFVPVICLSIYLSRLRPASANEPLEPHSCCRERGPVKYGRPAQAADWPRLAEAGRGSGQPERFRGASWPKPADFPVVLLCSGCFRHGSRPTTALEPKAPATRRGAREISVCVRVRVSVSVSVRVRARVRVRVRVSSLACVYSNQSASAGPSGRRIAGRPLAAQGTASGSMVKVRPPVRRLTRSGTPSRAWHGK